MGMAEDQEELIAAIRARQGRGDPSVALAAAVLAVADALGDIADAVRGRE